MRVFITCILIVGPVVLLIVGFLSVVHDLLSRNILAAPVLPNEDEAADAEEAEPRSPRTRAEDRIDDLTVPEWALARPQQTMAISSRQHAGATRD
jgi:hypothetical protein